MPDPRLAALWGLVVGAWLMWLRLRVARAKVKRLTHDYREMVAGARRAERKERAKRDALRTAAERDRAEAGALLLLATVEYEGNLG